MDDSTQRGPGPAPDDDRAAAREREARSVERIRAGDQSAFAELYDDWFDRVHDLVARIVRDRDVAAEVTQDAFLTAWQKLDTLEQPEAFGGWLLRIARNRALNRLQREQRSVAVDDDVLAAASAGASVSAPEGFGSGSALARADDPAAAVEDGEVATLLWSAADALGERDTTVLTLQLRYGMTPAEIGEVVGVNRNAANQLVHRVKGRLEAAVRARVLWSGDGPACALLREELAAAGVRAFDDRAFDDRAFDDRAVKVVSRHAEGCDECGERQRLRLAPTALFGALPLLLAPAGVREQITAALAGEGVPVGGSSPGAGSGSGTGDTGSGTAAGAGRSGDAAGAAADAPPGGRSRRRALATAATVVVLLLAIVAAVVLTGGDRDGDDLLLAEGPEEDAVGTSTTTTTAAPTTTSAPPASVSPIVPGPGPSAPGSVAPAPPDAGAAPTPGGGSVVPPPSPDAGGGGGPTSAPVTAQLTVSPTSVPGTFLANPDLPVLSWTSSGAASATVTGPHLSTSGTSGSTRVCPSTLAPFPGGCQAQFGTYTWTLVARDGAGAVVAVRFATVTI